MPDTMTEPRWITRLRDAQSAATMLHGLAQGAVVLRDASEGDAADPLTRHASNGLVPLLDRIVADASDLANEIDMIESAQRRESREVEERARELLSRMPEPRRKEAMTQAVALMERADAASETPNHAAASKAVDRLAGLELGHLSNAVSALDCLTWHTVSQVGTDEPMSAGDRDGLVGAVESVSAALDRFYIALGQPPRAR